MSQYPGRSGIVVNSFTCFKHVEFIYTDEEQE